MTYHPRMTRAIINASLVRRAGMYVTAMMLGLIARAPHAVGSAAPSDMASADGGKSNPVGPTALLEVLDPPTAVAGDQSVTNKLAQLSDQELARMATLARALRVLAPNASDASRLTDVISDRESSADDVNSEPGTSSATTNPVSVTDGDINISLLADQIIHRAPSYQLGGTAEVCGPPVELTALGSLPIEFGPSYTDRREHVTFSRSVEALTSTLHEYETSKRQ